MSNLAQIMMKANGSTFISLDTETTPKLKGGKGNPYQGKVKKVMLGASVMVFTNKRSNGYENMVERRLSAEGKDPNNFKLSPRAWGERIENTPFVVHTGKDNVTKHYLEVIFLKAGEVFYTVDDIIVEPSTIPGLENKVIIRTFDVNNIKAITAFGERHEDLTFNPHNIILE